jgi:putative toxin-antitoxin system antitoxin component (TIGR02293 family)
MKKKANKEVKVVQKRARPNSKKPPYKYPEEEPLQVNEPEAAYFANTGGIMRWLRVPGLVTKKITSDFDIINLGFSGITKAAINTLAQHLGISRKFIAEDIFDISVKTFERKEDSGKLDRKTSSHALEIAKVLQHAYEVFRDEEKVKRWFNRENKALNNFKPVELFNTLSGLSMVNDILGRIQEGVYS